MGRWTEGTRANRHLLLLPLLGVNVREPSPSIHSFSTTTTVAGEEFPVLTFSLKLYVVLVVDSIESCGLVSTHSLWGITSECVLSLRGGGGGVEVEKGEKEYECYHSRTMN